MDVPVLENGRSGLFPSRDNVIIDVRCEIDGRLNDEMIGRKPPTGNLISKRKQIKYSRFKNNFSF